MTKKYEKIKKVGHYYWRELATGRIVVCDESAESRGGKVNPEWADGGILYLDTEALGAVDMAEVEKCLGYVFRDDRLTLRLPLLSPDGEKIVSVADLREFRFAAELARSVVGRVYHKMEFTVPTYDPDSSEEYDYSRPAKLFLQEEDGVRVTMGEGPGAPDVVFEKAVDRWRLFVRADNQDEEMCFIEFTDTQAIVTGAKPRAKPLLVRERVVGE